MMEPMPGDVDGNTKELTGRKKSRFKVFKSRLFGRLMKKETEGRMKQSQSTGDVNSPGGGRSEDDSEDDCLYPKGALSSRALSHDSIFLADQVQSSEPTRVLSQENVHSKIKALQLKLQKQNMRLVRPPLLIPGKRIEDSGITSEDDGLPCSPPELSFQEYSDPKKYLSWTSLAGTGSEEEEQSGSSQPSSRPLSPACTLSPKSAISSPSDLASPFEGVDFQSPAHNATILDSSAARHRMSIKPKNQRASSRAMRQPNRLQLKSSSMNSLDQPLSEMEETPQSVTHTQAMHYSDFSLGATLSEVSPPTSIHFQEQQWDGGPQSPLNSNRVTKLGKPFQPDGRIKTNPLFLQPLSTQLLSVFSDDSTTMNVSKHTREHLDEEFVKYASQYTDPIAVDVNERYEDNTACIGNMAAVTKVRTVSGMPDMKNHIETHSGNADSSKPAALLTSFYPVSASCSKQSTFTTVNTDPAKVFCTRPSKSEKEVAPFEGLDESLIGDKSRHSGLCRLSIVSALYRSKASNEQHVAKQDDESSGNAPLMKSPANNLALQVEKWSNTKNTEFCSNADTVPDKRSSLRRDVLTQNLSKTGMVNNPEKSQECSQNTEYEKIDIAEKSEDRQGLFGVKLRSTSLSLKYRSELATSEEKIKRHSLEAHHMPAIQSGDQHSDQPNDTEVLCNDRSNLHTNVTPQIFDFQQDLTSLKGRELVFKPLPGTGGETDSRSEPAWISLALEKTRIHQSFCNKLPTLSTSISSPTIQDLPKPTPQPKPTFPPTSISQQKTCLTTEPEPVNPSSQLSPSKHGPRAVLERWTMGSQRAEKNAQNHSTIGDEQVEVKGLSKPGSKNNTQIESGQQSQSDRSQPSWMELAKKKSLAWSDMSLD